MENKISELLTINRSIRNLLFVLLGIILIALLKQLADLLMPLVLACLLALLCIPLVKKLRKIGIPKIITLIITALVVGLSLAVVINIFVNTFSNILEDLDMLTEQFNNKVELINQSLVTNFNLNLMDETGQYTAWLKDWIGTVDWNTALKSTLRGLGGFGADFFLFLLYFLFLLGGLADYREYIDYVVGDSKELKSHTETLQKSISSYIAVKSIMSLGTGILVFITCLIFGLNYALFWGFTAFLFNFIPSIGSIISTVLPVLLAFVQFDGIGPFIGLGITLLAIQLIIGNVVDPLVMGDKMRLNSITVLFGLVFWGYIWGIPGMLLSVPLNVILKMVLEHSGNLSIASRIMGGAKAHNKQKLFNKRKAARKER